MRKARLDEAQAGIRIAGTNINNLTYAYDTTLMAESEEKLKNLLKMKEESEKVGLNPLGGTRRVGGLLGVAGRLSGTVSPFRVEQGTSLETPWRARVVGQLRF